MKKIKILSTVSLVFFFVLTPLKQSHAADAAGWVGAGICSVLYTPVKTAFALLMGITGGLSMIATVPAGDTKASAQIVKWGMYGDWLIRPDHLYGQNPVKFIGTENRARFVLVDPAIKLSRRD
ncbi:MAG: hypothetical protein ACRERU_04985 [Methylococcales bacterium]